MSNKRFWHYTPLINLSKIIESGHIKLSDALVPAWEKPAVWFSTNPFWENTCLKVRKTLFGMPFILTKKQMVEKAGLGRIEVSPRAAPSSWEQFKKLSRISNKHIKQMLFFANQVQAKPSQWYCNFSPVGSEFWITIEEWSEERQKWLAITL
ncbi:MAG TPA: hypothetical protein VF648_03210 [Pyrinomonadaceae bacterium]